MIRSSYPFPEVCRASAFALAVFLTTLGCTSPGDEDDGGQGGEGGEAEGGEGGDGQGGRGGQGGDGAQSGGSGGNPGGASGNAGGKGGANVKDVDFGIEKRVANPTCVAPPKPPEASGDTFPKTIRDTGCFDKSDPRKPVAGVIPYDVRAPLWSDDADKLRWMALPDGKKITIKEDGDFDFPIGSVLIKSFELDGVMLETRFMYRHADGNWAGYTYKWNEDGTDATLMGAAAEYRFVGNLEWVFPSRENCMGCHQEAAGRTLGPEVAQLNGPYVYAGGLRANQLRTLEHLELFDKPLGNVSGMPSFAPLDDDKATVANRARAYLHSNCAHCHRPGGVKEVVMDLRFGTAVDKMNVCNVAPSKGTFNIADDVKIIKPGDASSSIMAFRMRNLQQNIRMPSLGSSVVDEPGVAALEAWIKALSSCQ